MKVERYHKGKVQITANYTDDGEHLVTAGLYVDGKKSGFTTDVEVLRNWLDEHA